MRKSSRILSILLVACMLISAMVVAVSAAISTTPTKPAGATGSITPKTYTMSSTGNASNKNYVCANTGGNTIYNNTHDGASHGATCPNGGILFAAEDFIKPGGYKYATVDFDIMSDGYLKTEGDVISVDKEATSGKLAYRENIHISALLGGYTHFAYFVSNGDNWYLSADGVYSEDDVALATEKGAWNHVTMVDDGANVYVYLDGEFVAKKATSLSGKTYCRIGIDVSGIAKEDAVKTGYSIKVGNVVANKYSADYASGEAYGIDDYMTAADFKAPLYNCADVVYNANYIYDKDVVAGQDAVTIEYKDKAPVSYQNVAAFNAALANMSASDLEGANIVSRRNLNALSLPNNISNISVTTTGTAKMTLNKTALYRIVSADKTADETVYTLAVMNYQDLLDASLLNSNITNLAKFDYDTSEKNFTISGSGLQNAVESKVQSFESATGASKYASVHNKANPTATSGNHYPYFMANLTADGKYFTVDMDLANVYYDNNVEFIQFSYFNSKAYEPIFYIVSNSDRSAFYLSTNNALDANDIMLSSSNFVWNHITYVITNQKAYTFLDGEYVGVLNLTANYTNFQRFAMRFSGISATNYNVKANVDIDNIAINKYTANYTSGEAYGLDDYMAELTTTNKNLTDCVDVVYNSSYMYRATGENQNISAIIELADGTKTVYTLDEANSAIAAIESLSADQLSDATIYIRKINVDVDKLAKGANGFMFIADGGEVTGGNNYSLALLKSENGRLVYSINYLYTLGEGITNVGTITDGKTMIAGGGLNDFGYYFGNSQYATSGTVGSKQTVVANGIYNDYQQIMNDGSHAAANNNGVKFLNNNSQIWFGLGTTPLSAYKYITFDFDFMSDKYLVDGKLSDTGSELAYVHDSTMMFYNGINVKIVKDNGAWYVTYGSNKVALAKEAGVWNHFTFITTSEGMVYAFVNGELLGSVSKAATTNIQRLIYATNGCAYTAFSYAFDNVSVNKYALGGEYGLDAFFANDTYKTTPLYEVNDVVYNRDYRYYGFVDGQYVASVTDKAGNKDNFFFLEDALENVADGVTLESRVNVPAIDPEDTIMSYTVITKFGATMAKPADKYYKISKSTSGTTTTYVLTRVGEDELVIVNFEIYGDDTLIFSEQSSDVKGAEFSLSDEFLAALADLMEYTKGDYKWMIDMGNGFEFADECLVPGDYANEEVTVRIAAISVTWLNGAGEVVDMEAWFAGNEILPYNIAPLSDRVVTGNGWYDMDYTTWETDGKDMLNNKFVAAALTPMVFKAKMTPVPAVTDVKLNMSLLTKFEANLYITNRPLENIKLDGIFSDAELTLDMIADLELAELNGNTYFLDNFFFDNSDVDKVVSRYVQYTVNYEGGVITLVEEIQVSLLDYAQKVLAQYGCGSEEANLAYNLINYANAAYALKTGADYDDAVTFLALDGHEDCACKNTYAYVGDEVYYGENTLGENVLGWSFDVSNEQPAFVIYVMIDEFDNALVEDIEFAFFGINGTEVSDIAVKLVRGENIEIDGVVYATFFFEDMPLYNAAEMFTITVTDATTGEVYVTNCSLATYIDYAIWSEMDAAALKVAEALYSFAKVAKDYKLN